MTVILDTQQVAPLHRAEAIREIVWKSVVRVEIEHHPEPGQISARGRITDVGNVGICSIRSNATTVRRTPKLARDDMAPSVFLGLQVAASSMVIQGERQAVLRPGDMALYDTTAPYTLLNDDGIYQHFFRIPRSDLALPPDAITQLTAIRLSPDDALVDLAASYFRRLARHQMTSDLSGIDAVGQSGIELVRALLTTHLAGPGLSREPLEATLPLRVMEYVRAHLAEQDLSAARIAAAHNISVRHLYAILARSGIGLGDWIRAHRLENCRKDLARPGARSMTIASVAYRWGFGDATHFGRVFKDAYGMSPREWRELRQGGHPVR